MYSCKLDSVEVCICASFNDQSFTCLNVRQFGANDLSERSGSVCGVFSADCAADNEAVTAGPSASRL